MTEAEWLACTDPTPMLYFLGGEASVRKLSLFACACCRRIRRMLKDGRSRRALEIAEAHQSEPVDSAAFVVGWNDAADALSAAVGERDSENHRGSAVALECLRVTAGDALRASLNVAQWIDAGFRHGPPTPEQRAQAQLLRDIFGNPFRPSPPLPPAVLAWHDATVRRIAEGVYQDWRMPEGTLDTARLAILADALLDAGCDGEELIQHCRSEGPHVRGCWVVDLILGKE
jgi:hypothetical protein